MSFILVLIPTPYWLRALRRDWLMQRNALSKHPAEDSNNILPLINHQPQLSALLGKLGSGNCNFDHCFPAPFRDLWTTARI